MRPIVSAIGLLAAASFLLPLSANAQLFRAYLSSTGDDTHPCTVASPCRLLPAALAAVNGQGEIWMLDSANYNQTTVTISKNVIIQAVPGQIGSIVPSNGTPAVIISAGVTVSLRNIAIVTNTNLPGSDGIQMSTGTLSVENSIFEVWGNNSGTPNGNAIVVNGGTLNVHNSVFRHGLRGVFAQNGAKVDVSDSKFSDMGNGSSSGAGIYVEGGASTTSATVTRCEFTGSYVGMWVRTVNPTTLASATVSNSSFSQNNYGVAAQTASTSGVATVSGSGNNVSNNSYGIQADGSGSGNSAAFEGIGNNIVRNNVQNTSTFGTGSITTVPAI